MSICPFYIIMFIKIGLVNQPLATKSIVGGKMSKNTTWKNNHLEKTPQTARSHFF